MKAQLTNGQIVELEKDCECVIHDGPHWLHMDAFDKAQNRELIEKAKALTEGQPTMIDVMMAEVHFRRIGELERVRLITKLNEMESRKIERLIE
jgi:hypothetical protein